MQKILAPDINDSHVLALVASLKTGSSTTYVDHIPLPDKPCNECFPTVEEHVKSYGGESVFGWAIQQFPGIWLEAEFHAVWKSPHGQLIDLSPRQILLDKLLFLPDSNRKYEGMQVESVFYPLTDDPNVLKHIRLAHEFFEETNRGSLAHSTSYPLTPKIQAIEIEMQLALANIAANRSLAG